MGGVFLSHKAQSIALGAVFLGPVAARPACGNFSFRMQDPAVRKRAEELLGIAVRTLPGGPRLQSQVEALQELLDWAGKEINLTLESDNQTDVTIYHVGNLGRFFSRTVKLVPGTYTIVGSRPGYRDTRKTVKIGSEESITRLTITCSEPI